MSCGKCTPGPARYLTFRRRQGQRTRPGRTTPHEEPGIGEAIAAETAAPAVRARSRRALAQVQPSEPPAPDRRQDTEPTWDALYDRLERDWNELVTVANQERPAPSPGTRVRRTHRARAGPRRSSRTPFDRTGRAGRAARLPPERNGRTPSRPRLPRSGGASRQSRGTPPEREPNASQRAHLGCSQVGPSGKTKRSRLLRGWHGYPR